MKFPLLPLAILTWAWSVSAAPAPVPSEVVDSILPAIRQQGPCSNGDWQIVSPMIMFLQVSIIHL